MRFNRKAAPLLLLGLCLGQTGCFWLLPAMLDNNSRDQISSTTLLQAAREYAATKPLYRTASTKTVSFEAEAAAERSDVPTNVYERHVKSLLTGWDFAGLDKEAAEVRASKARVLGGQWKLSRFYSAVSEPPGGSSETDWIDHLEALKQWAAKEPNSATPHIALAASYINYAWHARGNGVASTVTRQEWQEYYERINLAAQSLLDAAKMKERCPVWFSTMQTVALAEGWDKQQVRELFELASSFEPDFLTYDAKYTYYLTPKWYGEPGESEEFVNATAQKLGGQKGQVAYFEMAVQLVCTCESDRPPLPSGLSWPKIREGFEAINRLYGVSNQQLNDYALIAYAAGDKATAHGAFAKIGDDWSEKTWWRQDVFKDAKAWASGM
ncbi:MAG TPA: DUF4034 domain-containing protein [Verrucomicrobiae bacterium]|nr:DUF4034 domain-containing protein [Verrucomicrobiae bacterium]